MSETMHNVAELVLQHNGFSQFNPLQSQALTDHNIYLNNILVSAPTSSGKSISPDTPVLVFDISHNEFQLEKIESIWNLKNLSLNQVRLVKPAGTSAILNPNLRVYSFNPSSGKLELTEVDAILRHKAPAKMYKVMLASGRYIICTGDHNQITIKDGLITKAQTRRLSSSDYIAVPKALPLPAVPIMNILPIVKQFSSVKNAQFFVTKKFIQKYIVHYTDFKLDPKLNNRQIKILSLLKKRNYTVKKLMPLLSLSKRQIEYDLAILLKKKQVYSFSNKKRGIYFVYFKPALSKEPYCYLKKYYSVTALALQKLGLEPSVLRKYIKYIHVPTSKTPDSLPIKPLWEASPEFFELLGYLIGEGSCSSLVTFTNLDPKVIARVNHLLGTLFNIRLSYVGKLEYRIYSSAFAVFLQLFNFGSFQNSYEKDIPNCIFSSSHEAICRLIAALIESEAEIKKDVPQLNIVSASYNVINKLAYLLSHFGVRCRIRKVFKRATNSHHKGNWYYNLSIYVPGLCYTYFGKYLISKRKKLAYCSSLQKNFHYKNTDPMPGLERKFEQFSAKLSSFSQAASYLDVSHDLVRMYARKERVPNRYRLSLFLQKIKKFDREFFVRANFLVNSDLMWDKVDSVKVIDNKNFKFCKFVYDLTVSDQKKYNFVAGFGGIVTHNTLLAHLTALDCILNRKQKVIYTCPLRALASEHFHDLKEKYSQDLNIRIALSTGDLDSASKYLSKYDLICTTSEKLDSLLRHNAEWLKQIGLLIVDEIHTLDSDRGPVIEMVIAKLRMMNPGLQILALSATVPNAHEIAAWLNAELIQSNYRPVPLKEGVLLVNTVYYSDYLSEELETHSDSIHSAVQNVMEREKQILVFVQTRKRAESLAKNLSERIYKQLSEKEKRSLENLSKKIIHSLETPTEQCKNLAEAVAQGIAFHHAGITPKQRKLIEDNFRNRLLKAIVATSTLGAGLNMPCETVLVTSIQRYTENGMTSISVNEFKQMMGRAGRPKYDTTGRAWVIAKHKHEKDKLLKNYIQGSLENIYSKLGIEPILRMHALSLIASEYVFDYRSLENFFSKTFYAKQYGGPNQLLSKLRELILELAELKFIQFNSTQNAFVCTPLGKRVSDLYLDPLSAHTLLQSLEFNLEPFSALFTLCNTFEMKPYINIPARDKQDIWVKMKKNKNELPLDFDQVQFTDPDLLQKFYSALVFQDFIDEVSEQTILENCNVRPGVLHAKLQRADWLCYSAIELARLQGKEKNMQLFTELRARLKYGCKTELLELVELKGIGRVRARKLYANRIASIMDIKNTDVMDLEKLLGKAVAVKVKKQLGQIP